MSMGERPAESQDSDAEDACELESDASKLVVFDLMTWEPPGALESHTALSMSAA